MKVGERLNANRIILLARIDHRGDHYDATYHVQRRDHSDATETRKCSTYDAARLWIESAGRVNALPVTWDANSYTPS